MMSNIDLPGSVKKLQTLNERGLLTSAKRALCRLSDVAPTGRASIRGFRAVLGGLLSILVASGCSTQPNQSNYPDPTTLADNNEGEPRSPLYQLLEARGIIEGSPECDRNGRALARMGLESGAINILRGQKILETCVEEIANKLKNITNADEFCRYARELLTVFEEQQDHYNRGGEGVVGPLNVALREVIKKHGADPDIMEAVSSFVRYDLDTLSLSRRTMEFIVEMLNSDDPKVVEHGERLFDVLHQKNNLTLFSEEINKGLTHLVEDVERENDPRKLGFIVYKICQIIEREKGKDSSMDREIARRLFRILLQKFDQGTPEMKNEVLRRIGALGEHLYLPDAARKLIMENLKNFSGAIAFEAIPPSHAHQYPTIIKQAVQFYLKKAREKGQDSCESYTAVIMLDPSEEDDCLWARACGTNYDYTGAEQDKLKLIEQCGIDVIDDSRPADFPKF